MFGCGLSRPALPKMQAGPLPLELRLAKGKSACPSARPTGESCHFGPEALPEGQSAGPGASRGRESGPSSLRALGPVLAVWPTSPLADENYSSYYSAGDCPVVRLLREPVYAEVAARRRADPGLGCGSGTAGPRPAQTRRSGRSGPCW